MPTFTAIALDNLLEPGSRNPNHNPNPLPNLKKSMSPILYATPNVTPIPESPSSFTPSPYIINHKIRGPRLLKSLSQDNVVNGSHLSDNDRKAEESNMNLRDEEESKGKDSEEIGGKSGNLEVERVGELDDFLEFQDSMSITSNTELDERSWKLPSTPTAEYYDAFEEISSDGSTRSSFRSVEDDLREMRLNVLMEIEKRKQAEESLERLRSQWQILSQHLSVVGFTLPTLPADDTDEGREQSSLDPAEELCLQVVIARAVSDAIGRACGRAEVEKVMEPQIESKNFEIVRLMDRLQYYEAANREMSQRNQEAVEMARQQRHQRKRRQRWIWSSIGLAVTLGAAAVAWSYVPPSQPLTHEGEATSNNGDQAL